MARSEMKYLPLIHTDRQTRDFITRLVNSGNVSTLKEDGVGIGFMVVDDSWLHHLYVAPAFQSKGYGTLLIRYAKKLSPDELKLWVFEENRHAIKFYEKEGFKLVIKREKNKTTNEEGLADRMYEWRQGQN